MMHCFSQSIIPFILCASRPEYKWAFFSDTIVYQYTRETEDSQAVVVFWDVRANEACFKPIPFELHAVAACGSLCALAVPSEEAVRPLFLRKERRGNQGERRWLIRFIWVAFFLPLVLRTCMSSSFATRWALSLRQSS